MKVCGFSFIRNAIKFDYPIREALLSIAPLCDEIFVAVGKSEDGTEKLIHSILPEKIRIIPTVWDERLRKGGVVLAEETNKAKRAIPQDYDWCIYIQGDEVLHESGHQHLQQAMTRELSNSKIEGFVLDYLHFYGSYDFIGDSRKWYRREVRVLRNDPSILSYKDAQGFRKEGRKLRVKKAHASMHHYGWVKDPRRQQRKHEEFNKLWHDDDWVARNVAQVEDFDYSQIDSLRRFQGSHPKVMQERIDKINWTFDYDPSKRKIAIKERLSRWIEQKTGWRPGEYKNYEII